VAPGSTPPGRELNSPAIGPGDPIHHAAQRRLLGRLATARLGALNGGAALVTLGFGPAAGIAKGSAGADLVGLGLAGVSVGIGVTLGLLIAAVRPVRRHAAPSQASTAGA
jgi:hypothetical protein